MIDLLIGLLRPIIRVTPHAMSNAIVSERSSAIVSGLGISRITSRAKYGARNRRAIRKPIPRKIYQNHRQAQNGLRHVATAMSAMPKPPAAPNPKGLHEAAAKSQRIACADGRVRGAVARIKMRVASIAIEAASASSRVDRDTALINTRGLTSTAWSDRVSDGVRAASYGK